MFKEQKENHALSGLCKPLRLGRLGLPNHVLMAPLTRMRAGARNVPTDLNATYYAQRASAGLIIAEGAAVSEQEQGYPDAPGMYTPEQIASWRTVAEKVHAAGGRIFQIAHNGRNSHSSLMPDGGPPVAPSAVASTLSALSRDFQQVPIELPRPLEIDEIHAIVESFATAAANAMAAGFDGIEVQGSNSHLIDQFLEDGTNLRTDRYGGSISNRMRFLAEIVESVTAAIGLEKLGVRLSPFGQYGGIHDSNPMQLYTSTVQWLNGRNLAYLHLIEGRASEIRLDDALHDEALNNAQLFRSSFEGCLVSAGAFKPDSAARAVEAGHVDAVAFGRSFISNPDLPARIAMTSASTHMIAEHSTAAVLTVTRITAQAGRRQHESAGCCFGSA